MVGINIQNIDASCARYYCPVCTFLLREPVQLSCGHRYCESCVGEQNRTTIECRQCKAVTLRSQMFYDRGMKNDMEVLNINCSSCPWNGLLKNYQDHLTKNHSNAYTSQNIGTNAVSRIREVAEKFKEYSKNVQLLKVNMKQLSFETSICKTSIEEQNPPKENLPQNQNFISSNGRLLLIIDNIQSRLNNKSVFTSEPFYTSPYGYKMCVRLYLNGNGIGQSTHVSIFLIVMRGEYDAIQEWPFNFQIIFCLYDLMDKKSHIIKSFQSDTKSICFQRPQGEMNIASGIPKFIPISKLQQDNNPYLCDGSIFIQVMIRIHPIPKSILSNVMCIDPALPIYIQEEIIQKEIEKNKMQEFKLILTLKSY